MIRMCHRIRSLEKPNNFRKRVPALAQSIQSFLPQPIFLVDGYRKAPTSLTLHWSQPSILKEQPVVHLIPLTATLGVRDLVLGIVTFNEVQHDASGLEQIDFLAVSEFVG